MHAIADPSRSPIGALYNFPDKRSVAATLRRQYSEELHARLKSPAAQSEKLSARFAASFIGCITCPGWAGLAEDAACTHSFSRRSHSPASTKRSLVFCLYSLWFEISLRARSKPNISSCVRKVAWG